MSALPFPRILIADGSYEFDNKPGASYLMTLKGVFGGATVAMTTESGVTAETYDSVADGSWTAEAEINFRAPSSQTRLTVTGATGTTAIRVSVSKHSLPDH